MVVVEHSAGISVFDWGGANQLPVPVAFSRVALAVANKMLELPGKGKSRVDSWIAVLASDERPGYMTAIEEQDWDGLATKAKAELRARRNDINEMMVCQADVSEVLAEAQGLVRLMKTIRARLDPDDATFQSIAEASSCGNPGLDAVANLWKTDFRDILKPLKMEIQFLNEVWEEHIASRTAATLALAVAQFNEAYQSQAPSAAEELPSTLKETESKILNHERGIWKALSSRDAFVAGVLGAELAETCARILLDKAIPRAVSAALRRRDSGTDADGRAALRCGDLLRSCLRGVALGHKVRWICGIPLSDEAQEWMRAAQKLSFSNGGSRTKTTAISAVAMRPGRYEGKTISVEGVLGLVTIAHEGRKAISTVAVRDPNGVEIPVVLKYIKIDSAGMVPGAYVRMAGTWGKTSELGGKPALLLDRQNLSKASCTDWRDWVTLRLRAIFDVVPHSLDASWSWEPGTDGAGNQILYGTWADR